MQLKLVEDDLYYYDAEAAERPITFIPKYLRHYEDRYAGEPFLLLDWQQEVIRTLFGWKRRSDGKRRFRELYLEIAKGNGKSPFLTALALYVFFAEKQEGQQIFSIATDFKQANITHEMAKKMIAASSRLSERVDIKQFDIVYPRRNGKWSIMSGTAEGKHGFRPNVVVADEAHEWDNRKLYDNVTSNLLKRSEPLMLIATNAGSDRSSICYELHERAMRVLNGTSKDDTLLPVIYCADKNDPWDSEATWRKANPSLDSTITVDALRLECIKAKENPALENRFRRLYLSQWVQQASKWLDINEWDKCVRRFRKGQWAKTVNGLPLYIGLDLSISDDLSAVSRLWVGEKMYAKVRHYIPRTTASRYEDKENVPYSEWAANKQVTIIHGNTIDDRALLKIERHILHLKEKYKLQAVMYDPRYAGMLVARLERQGIACVKVNQKQGYEYSAATKRFEALIQSGGIVLPDNACLRWQASHVEVEPDKFGNIIPVKEHAKGRYAGRRGLKIDGIVSVIIALSRAMGHEMRQGDDSALRNWDGSIVFL